MGYDELDVRGEQVVDRVGGAVGGNKRVLATRNTPQNKHSGCVRAGPAYRLDALLRGCTFFAPAQASSWMRVGRVDQDQDRVPTRNPIGGATDGNIFSRALCWIRIEKELHTGSGSVFLLRANGAADLEAANKQLVFHLGVAPAKAHLGAILSNAVPRGSGVCPIRFSCVLCVILDGGGKEFLTLMKVHDGCDATTS